MHVTFKTREHAYLEDEVVVPETADGLLVTHHVHAAPDLALSDRDHLQCTQPLEEFVRWQLSAEMGSTAF